MLRNDFLRHLSTDIQTEISSVRTAAPDLMRLFKRLSIQSWSSHASEQLMEISLNDNNLWQLFTSESIARHRSCSGVINSQPDESSYLFSQTGKEKCLFVLSCEYRFQAMQMGSLGRERNSTGTHQEIIKTLTWVTEHLRKYQILQWDEMCIFGIFWGDLKPFRL